MLIDKYFLCTCPCVIRDPESTVPLPSSFSTSAAPLTPSGANGERRGGMSSGWREGRRGHKAGEAKTHKEERAGGHQPTEPPRQEAAWKTHDSPWSREGSWRGGEGKGAEGEGTTPLPSRPWAWATWARGRGSQNKQIQTIPKGRVRSSVRPDLADLADPAATRTLADPGGCGRPSRVCGPSIPSRPGGAKSFRHHQEKCLPA